MGYGWKRQNTGGKLYGYFPICYIAPVCTRLSGDTQIMPKNNSRSPSPRKRNTFYTTTEIEEFGPVDIWQYHLSEPVSLCSSSAEIQQWRQRKPEDRTGIVAKACTSPYRDKLSLKKGNSHCR